MKKFISFLENFYTQNKRDSLPWRKTRDPYKILVSEIMLQQTQVSRVLVKYKEFIQTFPTAKSLASAQLRDVLVLWQGLGYNRRAKFLYQAAQKLSTSNKKDFSSYEFWTSLPGVGQSTAGAVLAFTQNKPVLFIETNIRAVLLHHFFKDKTEVHDTEVRNVLQKLLNSLPENFGPRDFYYALYDYGSELKQKLGKQKTKLHQKSKHYSRQSKFSGSRRQLRAFILKVRLGTKTMKDLPTSLKEYTKEDIASVKKELRAEGLI